jgi:hypothetical protein
MFHAVGNSITTIKDDHCFVCSELRRYLRQITSKRARVLHPPRMQLAFREELAKNLLRISFRFLRTSPARYSNAFVQQPRRCEETYPD